MYGLTICSPLQLYHRQTHTHFVTPPICFIILLCYTARSLEEKLVKAIFVTINKSFNKCWKNRQSIFCVAPLMVVFCFWYFCDFLWNQVDCTELTNKLELLPGFILCAYLNYTLWWNYVNCWNPPTVIVWWICLL